MNASQLASELGKHGRGKKKTMSAAAIEQRRTAAQSNRKKAVMKALGGRLTYTDLPEPKKTTLLTTEQLREFDLPERKHYARKIARLAMNEHRIKAPEQCSLCTHGRGFKRMIAHHEDYLRPLRVAFVCNTCHVKLHRGCVYC